MTFIRARMTPNRANITRLTDGFRRAPAVMHTLHRRSTRRFINRTLDTLKTRSRPVKYPIDWTPSPLPTGRRPNLPRGRYSKQKAAFFATNGFGGGIPHRSKDRYIKAWKAVFRATDMRGIIEFTNHAPGAIYIGGILQQPMHRGRYAYAPGVIREASKEYQKLVYENWRTAADPRAGVR